MAETTELMHGVLESIPGRLDELAAGAFEVRQEMVLVHPTPLGMQNDVHNIRGVPARNEDRLHRTERRLELREAAEPGIPHRPA